MDKNQRRRKKSRRLSTKAKGRRSAEGLEIEAGFARWLALLRQHFGSAYSWHGPFASDLARVEAIDRETDLLLRVASEWSAEEFYSAYTGSDADVTKGSEHYVTRYFDGDYPRVMKATIPGKYGRHEYSPSLYLNSWRLFQQFVPALDMRLHGILVQPVPIRDRPLPSIVTSMQYVEGRHPSPRQIRIYMERRGWLEYTDASETQDYIHEQSGQLIRDAHPGNWIKQRESSQLIPVDISIEQL